MPTWALEKAMGEDVIASCIEIETEILRVLTEKLSWERDYARSALETVLSRAVHVRLRGTVKQTGCRISIVIDRESGPYHREPGC